MEEMDNTQMEAMQEVVYGTNAALETLIQLLVEKGIVSESEFKAKMESIFEESEEVLEDEHDANAPRDAD
jgi:hypothetical protein